MSTRIVRWNPANSIRPRMVAPGSFGWAAPYWDSRVAMPLDIEENEDNFVVKASLPGFAPEDVKVEVEDGVLTIRAEHASEEEQEREGWHLRERYAGTVERKLRLVIYIGHEEFYFEKSRGEVEAMLRDLQVKA